MSVDRELWEKELGRIALAAMDGIHGAGVFESVIEHDAIVILQAIQDILNSEDLSDFNCVEEIVSLLERAGISTTRHDFG